MNDVATVQVKETDAGATLFAFLDVADRMYERISDALGKVGLSYPKYEVLDYLRTTTEPVSLKTLADCQSCARSNITQLMDKLEVEGLVRRVPDPEDRRGVRAELTEDGSARWQEGRTQLDLVLAEFAASFTTPERVQLGRLLSRLG